jgi:hypothetical protein
MPANIWQPAVQQKMMSQQQAAYTPPAMGQNFHSRYQSAMMTPPVQKSVEQPAAYFPVDMTIEDITWTSMPEQNKPLAMDFFSESNPDYATDNFEDLVQLDNSEMWDMSNHNNPSSPDRRSWSEFSSSSGENSSELPELADFSQSTTDFSTGLEMVLENERTPKPYQGRTGRSTSRPPPSSRASSNRRFRTSPYRVPQHTRCSSVMSTASSVANIGIPITQCCSPLEEHHDEFILPDFEGLDFSTLDNSEQGVSPENLFGTTGDFDAYFNNNMSPLVAPQPQYAVDKLFLQNNFEGFQQAPTVLPSSSNIYETTSAPVSAASIPEQDFSKHAPEPDLFGRLSQDALLPPDADMHPEDTDMTPIEQETRFDGDLYTPRFVRGHGNKREGWCGLCPGGRWLVLKNSAFWYDKSFSHGISAATGMPFEGPRETRRMAGNPDVWEGLCGSCDDWIALISSKKKGTTWFRHAYKVCFTQPILIDLKNTNYDDSATPTKKQRTHQSAAGILAAVPAAPRLPSQKRSREAR